MSVSCVDGIGRSGGHGGHVRVGAERPGRRSSARNHEIGHGNAGVQRELDALEIGACRGRRVMRVRDDVPRVEARSLVGVVAGARLPITSIEERIVRGGAGARREHLELGRRDDERRAGRGPVVEPVLAVGTERGGERVLLGRGEPNALSSSLRTSVPSLRAALVASGPVRSDAAIASRAAFVRSASFMMPVRAAEVGGADETVAAMSSTAAPHEPPAVELRPRGSSSRRCSLIPPPVMVEYQSQ